MNRLVYDPYVEPASISEYGVSIVALDELLTRADFVSIHCVLTPETKGLIDAAALQYKPHVV